MTTLRNVEDEIRRKLSEVDDIIFDWMEEMDMPDGTTISGDVHDARGKYLDAILKNMNDLLKAVNDEVYCMECGVPIPEDEIVWNHDHECFCPECASRKNLPPYADSDYYER